MLKVSVLASGNAYNVQERLGYICRQILPEVMERICNAICTEDYRIKLNTVSLDLGTLPAAELENAVPEKLAEKLAGALRAYTGSEGEYSGEIDMQKKSPITSAALLKHFLSTGTLPAWTDSGSIHLHHLFDSAMAAAPDDISRFLRHSPYKNRLCKRLAAMLDKQQLKALAALLTQTNDFDALIDEWLMPGNTAPARPDLLKESLLSYLLHYKSQNDSFIPQLKALIKARPEDLAQLIVSAGRNDEKYTGIAKTLRQKSSLIPEATVNDVCKGIVELLSNSTTFRRDLHQLLAAAGSEVRSEQDNKTHHRSPSGNKAQLCPVHNAGLVILWPGIPSLLETCGLVRNNAFTDEEAAERAVLLLQYAADGRQEIPEYELPLNKILCGLPVDTPVATAFEPTAKEKAAVQDLLETIITGWGALKGSSTEALQMNYLQREGTLAPKGDHFQLHVERRTRDVLLERLPWGIWVIKLPWMHQILYTEW